MIRYLLEMEKVLDRILQKWEAMKMSLQDALDKLHEADVETTRIANRIADLLAALQAGGMSAGDEEVIFAELSAHVEKLKTVGVVTP